MSNYLPHHTKKLQILSRREFSLFVLLQTGAPRDKIVRAVEQVRDARIRVIEAQTEGYTLPSVYERQVEMVRNLPVETILAYFGHTTDNPKLHDQV